MTFREFYTEHPRLLTEMPSRTGLAFPDPFMDNISVNTEDTQASISNLTKTFSEDILGRALDLYRDSYSEAIEDSWVDPVVGCTAVKFNFYKRGEGLQSSGVHQLRQYPNIARYLIFNYYLEHFAFVQSDRLQSTQGESYWKKILGQAQREGYRVTVMNDKQETELSKDLEQYWGREPQHAASSFKIYSKAQRDS